MIETKHRCEFDSCSACGKLSPKISFNIERDEAKALYKLLQYEFIPHDDDYEVLMRMLNGLSNYIADTEPSK